MHRKYILKQSWLQNKKQKTKNPLYKLQCIAVVFFEEFKRCASKKKVQLLPSRVSLFLKIFRFLCNSRDCLLSSVSPFVFNWSMLCFCCSLCYLVVFPLTVDVFPWFQFVTRFCFCLNELWLLKRGKQFLSILFPFLLNILIVIMVS